MSRIDTRNAASPTITQDRGHSKASSAPNVRSGKAEHGLHVNILCPV